VVAWKRVDDLLAELPDSVAPSRADARRSFGSWYSCIDERTLSACLPERDEFVRQLSTVTRVVIASG
jgi:hypothetical protein